MHSCDHRGRDSPASAGASAVHQSAARSVGPNRRQQQPPWHPLCPAPKHPPARARRGATAIGTTPADVRFADIGSVCGSSMSPLAQHDGFLGGFALRSPRFRPSAASSPQGAETRTATPATPAAQLHSPKQATQRRRRANGLCPPVRGNETAPCADTAAQGAREAIHRLLNSMSLCIMIGSCPMVIRRRHLPITSGRTSAHPRCARLTTRTEQGSPWLHDTPLSACPRPAPTAYKIDTALRSALWKVRRHFDSYEITSGRYTTHFPLRSEAQSGRSLAWSGLRAQIPTIARAAPSGCST